MKNGDIEQMKQLVGKDAGKASTALFPAINEGAVEMARWLLSIPGINIDLMDKVSSVKC